MAVIVLPVDTGSYGAELHDDWIEAVSVQGDADTQGIVRGMLSELAVTGASSPVAVAAGWAIVKGKLVKVTSPEPVNIPTPSANPRIDRVAVQVDFTTSPVSASVVRVAGTEAATPSAPALAHVDGTRWQLPLAQVRVTTGGVITITNERRYLGHGHTDTDAIQDGAVTRDKLSAASGPSVVGRSANSAGAPADIAASADGQVLRRSGGTLGFGTVATTGIADNAVTTPKIANDAIDDTKVGARVPQFFRRQGGHETQWSGFQLGGNTNYVPGAVRVQFGYYHRDLDPEKAMGNLVITFPVAFSANPLVFISDGTYGQVVWGCSAISMASPEQADVYWKSRDGEPLSQVAMAWMAIGPE